MLILLFSIQLQYTHRTLLSILGACNKPFQVGQQSRFNILLSVFLLPASISLDLP